MAWNQTGPRSDAKACLLNPSPPHSTSTFALKRIFSPFALHGTSSPSRPVPYPNQNAMTMIRPLGLKPSFTRRTTGISRGPLCLVSNSGARSMLWITSPRNVSLLNNSTLWTQSRPVVGSKRSILLGTLWKSKGLPYYTSKPPDESQRKENKLLKKPLLKVLKQITPHENIYTIPNILTATRLVAAPIIGYLVLHDYHAWAVGLFTYAGITDLVDGWIARKWNLQTVVGTVIDPMADKTLMTILTVCLAIKGALPIWLATIILGRDVCLAISAIYFRWISLPPPKTFSRYWDFSLPSAEVHPTTISKYNTALQLALIGATTAMPLVTIDVTTAMTAMQYLVATTTVWSGASYIYTKDAVKILHQKNAPKKFDARKPDEK